MIKINTVRNENLIIESGKKCKCVINNFAVPTNATAFAVRNQSLKTIIESCLFLLLSDAHRKSAIYKGTAR